MNKLLAFNNDPKLKEELVAKLKHHQKLDTFIQGGWLTNEKVNGNGYKGCFYGCTMQTSNAPVLAFSEKYSIDLWYCYLTERLFEGLPDGEYQKFPLSSIKIIPVGFDFNKIKSPYFHALLTNQLQCCKNNKASVDALLQRNKLFETSFDKIYESAAWSAAWSAESAESAAWSAESAESAAWSAESAAWSAESAESAAWSAAKQNHYMWQKDLLFSLIKKFS